MKSIGVSAGLRKAAAAVAQPEGSSYAGKKIARGTNISVEAAAKEIRVGKQSTGKVVCDYKDCNPFRADKELSRKVTGLL